MIRAFQWDLARQVERLDWLLAQLPRYADWGYNELYLHLEDAVEYPSLPAVARRDAYSYKQFGRLVNAATRVGIKVVPIVNLLGHTQYLIKVPELRDLNELRAADGSPLERGQICPLHPRTVEVAKKLLRDMAPFCTAGKVHVGLDESFHLGKHPLSRREVARIGLAAHFANHVTRLRDLTRGLGLRMGMWADMLYFLPEAIRLLPADVATYEWYYYKFARRPRVELFNFAESDVGERLRARGIEYWGCPMNGAFRYEPMPHFRDRLDNITSWWRHCRRMKATGFLMTSWEPNRLAIELTTAIDAAAACLWLEPEISEPAAMLERGFARVFGGRRAKEAARVALACDRFPFGGYPRWQANERWDVTSRRESAAEYRREQKFFARAIATAKLLPAPLRSSIELRHYFAARDVFLHRRGANAHAFAATYRAGLRAARLMWSQTRDRRVHGPNEQILLRDAARLRQWQRGEPVFGGQWQLCYAVKNFAPAVQLVAVEQQQKDGAWRTLQSCHTIEFQSRAARPRGHITREHAAPVEWDGDVRHFPVLRIAIRGIGQVLVGQPVLTDGSASYFVTNRSSSKRMLLGDPAARRGFPKADSTQNSAQLPLTFRSTR